MYFESHAHYDDKRFNEDRDELLLKLKDSGVTRIVNVGADVKSSIKSVDLAKKYDFIYASVGVHPHEVDKMTEKDFSKLKELAQEEKVVAIGEIGLDYYYEHSPRDVQKEWFKRQLEFVTEINKPVIIHSRDAAQECFDIIQASKARKGVIHCYSGSAEMALEYIKLGYYIGIGGIVTFDKTKKLVEVAELIPMEKILIETDSPYLSPVPNRGLRNDSQNLKYITEKISEIKQIPHEKVAEISYKNAVELFCVK